MPKSKPPHEAVPVVCIQQIGTDWTKASRGGKGSILRNRVPEALPFSGFITPANSPQFLVQTTSFYESAEFVAKKPIHLRHNRDLQPFAQKDAFDFRGVSASRTDTGLDVKYEYKWEQGMPWRYSTTDEVTCLELGQWCRVSFNGRFSSYRYTAYGEGNGWYEKWVINIGLFVEPGSDVFLKTKPIKVYSRLAILL